MTEADVPADNEYSSGWMFGRRSVGHAGVKLALVRAHFYNGGSPAGLIEAQFYGLRRTASPQSVQLTYGWLEDGQPRRFEEFVLSDTPEHSFVVPTGSRIVDDFVRIEVK